MVLQNTLIATFSTCVLNDAAIATVFAAIGTIEIKSNN